MPFRLGIETKLVILLARNARFETLLALNESGLAPSAFILQISKYTNIGNGECINSSVFMVRPMSLPPINRERWRHCNDHRVGTYK